MDNRLVQSVLVFHSTNRMGNHHIYMLLLKYCKYLWDIQITMKILLLHNIQLGQYSILYQRTLLYRNALDHTYQ